jgi:hypothetical protein
MGEIKNGYTILEDKPKDERHLGDKDVDEKIILKWILKKQDLSVWTGLNWLRIWTSDGFL